jgi:hypothetical protein
MNVKNEEKEQAHDFQDLSTHLIKNVNPFSAVTRVVFPFPNGESPHPSQQATGKLPAPDLRRKKGQCELLSDSSSGPGFGGD